MQAATRELGALFDGGALAGLSDGQLLDRFLRRRDGPAFEAVVGRYGPLVWGVCRRALRDHHDAEDAFQATFLVLARKAASVRPPEDLGRWLYGVASRTAGKARATRARRRARERPDRGRAEPEAAPDRRGDESLSRLDREVARLPEKYRLPVILCELGGETHRQAAEQLGWPVGTVSGRLSRARALLAARLSRREAALTAGAAGALSAHGAASAAVPPGLARSAARAGSRSAAGEGVTAGAVSAEVAALTGEVLKAMVLDKLKLATAALLAALALVAGGTILTYRARATEPANPKQDSERPRERSNPAEAVREEAPPPEDRPRPAEATKRGRPKPAEAPKEDVRRPEGPERVTGEEGGPPPLLADDWQGARQRKLDCGAYSFTALRTGDAALAYNAATREVKAVRLRATKAQPLWVTPVAIESSKDQLVALGVRGSKITRVAVFNLKSGKWSPLDLDRPVNGGVWPIAFGPDTAAYEVGDLLYLFNPKTDAWDRLDLRTIADDEPEPRATKGR